jgi:Zn-dependent protease
MDLDPLFIRGGLIVFILLVGSIILHEWGHAVAADLLGDDTPRRDGRLTLNPLAHLDWMGTVFFPAINIFIFGGGLAFIGWGKPVATNVANYKHRSRDDLLVTMAGPATNLLVALVAVVFGAFAAPAMPRIGGLVIQVIVMNVGLAVFNLLPIPPLDGGGVLRHIAGFTEEAYLSISKWSWIALLLLLNIEASQTLIFNIVVRCCGPYGALCRWINPLAYHLIFRS